MKAGSWGDLSWTSFSKPKAAFDFTNRNKICFYDCGSHPLKKEVIPTLYADLTKSNFLNTYTSRNPYEDFADTFAFYVMFNTVASITYSLDTQQGAVYDIRKQLASDRMKPKVDYVKAFLAGASIKYPD